MDLFNPYAGDDGTADLYGKMRSMLDAGDMPEAHALDLDPAAFPDAPPTDNSGGYAWQNAGKQISDVLAMAAKKKAEEEARKRAEQAARGQQGQQQGQPQQASGSVDPNRPSGQNPSAGSGGVTQSPPIGSTMGLSPSTYGSTIGQVARPASIPRPDATMPTNMPPGVQGLIPPTATSPTGASTLQGPAITQAITSQTLSSPTPMPAPATPTQSPFNFSQAASSVGSGLSSAYNSVTGGLSSIGPAVSSAGSSVTGGIGSLFSLLGGFGA